LRTGQLELGEVFAVAEMLQQITEGLERIGGAEAWKGIMKLCPVSCELAFSFTLPA